MKLNHLNLTVSDVLETYRFLEKYFGLKQYGTLAPSKAMGFMSDDNGLVLALFHGKDGKVSYPPGFHIGFVQESEERVNEINGRLREDGFKVPKPARLHGSWTFLFQRAGWVPDGSFVLKITPPSCNDGEKWGIHLK